ncbi:MAG TPA: RND family transporter, partial [Planctomycetaceae bacterium]
MTAWSASLLARLVDLLLRHRLPIAAASALLTLAAVYPASQLTFNETVESMFAADDPHLTDYLASRRLFGGDELVGIVYRDPGLFEKEGLERAARLATELSHVPGVHPHSLQSIAGNLAAVDQPVFKTFFKKQIEAFRRRVIESTRGILVGDDDQTTSVVLRLVPESETSYSRGETIEAIRKVAAAHQERS